MQTPTPNSVGNAAILNCRTDQNQSLAQEKGDPSRGGGAASWLAASPRATPARPDPLGGC